jgi:dephospho-CoA kinase
VVVVVTSPEPVRVDRLTRRGMSGDDARARIRAQLTDADREAVAGEVIRNDGTEADLRGRVDELWATLRERSTSG